MIDSTTSAATRNTEEQLVRIRLDALIRQVWCALHDLSDYRNGDALTPKDLDLWERLRKPAFFNLANDQKTENTDERTV
jgi:hypothetical protein